MYKIIGYNGKLISQHRKFSCAEKAWKKIWMRNAHPRASFYSPNGELIEQY
jgi:hypothetical protein